MADATSSPILHSTPASEWLDVVGHGIRRLLPAERVIHREGQQARHLHLLLMGRVRISAVTPDGEEIVLALIEPPASFGEAACLDRLPQYATAVTSTECEVVSFPRHTVLRLMQEHLPLLEEVLAGLARKQRLHAGQLQAVSNQSAQGEARTAAGRRGGAGQGGSAARCGRPRPPQGPRWLPGGRRAGAGQGPEIVRSRRREIVRSRCCHRYSAPAPAPIASASGRPTRGDARR